MMGNYSRFETGEMVHVSVILFLLLLQKKKNEKEKEATIENALALPMHDRQGVHANRGRQRTNNPE